MTETATALHPTPAPAEGAVVAARAVTRRYGEGDTAVDALRGVSLDVSRGELSAVMGPSGSGKSTLMHILAGLDRPTSGEVFIDGTPIGRLGDTELTKLRRKHIGFVFQFFNLLPMLTAEENVTLPARIAGRKIDGAWLDSVLDQVGLLVTPAVALLSFAVTPALSLAFRPIELAAMGAAAVFVGFVIHDGKARRWEGVLLVAVYAAVVAGFWVAGDR